MKQVFAMSFAALMASASLAVAQDGDMFISRDDAGTYRVYGPDNMEGTELLVGENGAAPADCPEGSFYRNADNMIAACGTEDMFGVGPVEAGAMMSSGDPFPENSLMLSATGQPLPGEDDQEGGTQNQDDANGDDAGGDDAGGEGNGEGGNN